MGRSIELTDERSESGAKEAVKNRKLRERFAIAGGFRMKGWIICKDKNRDSYENRRFREVAQEEGMNSNSTITMILT